MSHNSKNRHEIVERNVGLLAILIVFAISLGALVEITPLIFQQQTNEPVDNLRPYTALEMEGRDIYIREGCHVCHSQMIRPFRSETERYGHYSVAGEGVWEHPFLWGSKRTGPDLARVGGRYSDEWHRIHLINPRELVPESNMPAYPWLAVNILDGAYTPKKLTLFRDRFGVPYTDEQIANAQQEVQGKTEMEAIIAYLQSLGHAMK
ncbi:cytochrome-c oxidase, cbb3-type subunit II [Vibrio cincinnatiensis]|jgi:cytochrome c oxidase cbb3-type subunit 2|uniref:Cytochrome c oxidase cbb3-type subunit 2 n=1 Tax=Vibrio cincinnatiensis DSM 19608 TaxID=1123491 RepID=A0A1T4RL77_VIBCI|nr:cytochrome-c oxidase, cbb3-type subunit II [Vibrio cincinnatiensis]MCG3721372.1 cytochrome-c oxidase, cbb3-type subunit II [Vibrio cincinnatiensis]MCG3725579.1 cytochrome-c oxidase, cbb3-type subunit II [Vibrio cincinnatiensis]MCG3732098.1 cytochrome-c oxidase, cbb3-type subunit II [Vibrio cincinnatiensis]MCG3736266.1 cytochrome-c oxidase, cbb3-type subunit II [Vibrio cincinnatiensis]MCG3739809.1 cytochrome-c oxidase, cbb3-type subunit II [Vibrio cincinnatiensis]